MSEWIKFPPLPDTEYDKKAIEQRIGEAWICGCLKDDWHLMSTETYPFMNGERVHIIKEVPYDDKSYVIQQFRTPYYRHIEKRYLELVPPHREFKFFDFRGAA
jgi:hypothetical protein